MQTTLQSRQRQALRQLKALALERARREEEVEAQFRQRTTALEHEYQNSCQRLEAAYQTRRQTLDLSAQEEQVQRRQELEAQLKHLAQTYERTKKKAIHDYAAAKDQATASFKETRWTVNALNEADRKVSQDQMVDAQRRCKQARLQFRQQQTDALERIKSWNLQGDLPAIIMPDEPAPNDQPLNTLENQVKRGQTLVTQIQAMRLPGVMQTKLPLIFLCLACLVTALPAWWLPSWWYVFLGVAALLVLPVGLGIIYWLQNKARQNVGEAWYQHGKILRLAAIWRKRALEKARRDYISQRRLSKARHRNTLDKSAEDTRQEMRTARRRRNSTLKKAQKKFQPFIEDTKATGAAEMKNLEDNYLAEKTRLDQSFQHEGDRLAEILQRRREEINRQHASEWTHLVADWKNGLDVFAAETRSISQECRNHFLPWSDPHWVDWHPPQSLPSALPMGQFQVTDQAIPNLVPQAKQMPQLDLATLDFPALLPFPANASLLVETYDEGRQEALQALQALLLRAWTGLPPGKTRCTILDAVGRGDNFAAFMHLADFDEAFVHGRIWTEPSQIEEKLRDLTTHVDNVLQKYLRNQFSTLAEYNAQAEEVAEPYHFLIVANFPINFTPDAARRLVSLARAGPRCGVYVIVQADLRLPLPEYVALEDLEEVSTTLIWRQDHFAVRDPDFIDFPLRLESPPPPEQCTAMLRRAGEWAHKMSRVEVPFTRLLPPPEKWWTADSRHGLTAALGRAGATGQQMLELGKGTAQHVLVAGKTGSGKSTLLHVLITQIALRYAPDQVALYLIDFKKGVEFKTYAFHELPHARVVAVESEREFGLSVLQKLDAELVRRGELFRAVGVNDLAGYRDKNQGNAQSPDPMPRVLLVVDEFQEFFVEDDKVAQEAGLLLDRLVRQGRAFGLHIFLGSQTLGGAYTLARSTIDQMAVRIALQCSEADAHLILDKDNSEARLLSRPGEAIYNASGGLLEGNHLFQVAWLDDRMRDDLLRQVRTYHLQRNGQAHVTPIVFEGNAPSDLARNPLLLTAGAGLSKPTRPLSAWLGEAVAIKDPTTALFRRQSGANLLILGQQESAVFGMLASALVGLGEQLEPSPAWPTPLHLVVGAAPEEEGVQVLEDLPNLLPLRLLAPRELSEVLDRMAEEVNRRLKDSAAAEPLFLVLFGLQRLRDLRRPDDEFAFRKEEKPSPFKQFLHIAREGPPLGVFTILCCDTLGNLQRTLDRTALREFEMRVLFQMSPTDSSTLIDSPQASKLGLHRALLYAEDQGKLEKFRPYGLPELSWLRERKELV